MAMHPSAFHKFRITSDSIGRGVVEMDGQRLRGVRRVEFSCEAGDTPIVQLHMYAGAIEADTMAEADPLALAEATVARR